MNRYFLYARKSTDDDDRQVLSIEAQLAELREFARKEKLRVADELVESRTAKVPGRPVFTVMVERIQAGEADGIVSWHPDRLARNSVDGGQLIYLLDTGQLRSLKFPTFWFEPTPQGKFMLNIAFGQSKYFVDNLRENVWRGIRQKLRRGEFPGRPILGYVNDLHRHIIVPDPERAPLVRRMFEAYASGAYTVPELLILVTRWGLRNRGGKPLTRSNLYDLLAHPFYVGLIRYDGEIYEGSHEPLVSKETFDWVQHLLRERSRPRVKALPGFSLVGLLHCGACGCSVTAERQKGHVYYRCTKKRGQCDEPYVREEALAAQLRSLVGEVALPEEWATPILTQFDAWAREEAGEVKSTKRNLETQLAQVNMKLERLLDAHLDGAISREEYVARKEHLLHTKAGVQEQLCRGRATPWLEPARDFIQACTDADSVARSQDLQRLRSFLRSSGSNLTLRARQPHRDWENPWSLVVKWRRNPEWLRDQDSNLEPTG